MKRKIVLLTLLCSTLCLALPGCASKIGGTANESSQTTQAEGKTTISADLDDAGEELLNHVYTTWIPNPSQAASEGAPSITLTQEKGAQVGGDTYNVEISTYSNDNDTALQFNIDLLPDGDGKGYRLLVVYLPMDGTYSENEFFMLVNEGEITGDEFKLSESGEIIYVAEKSENASSDTPSPDPSTAKAGDDLLPEMPEETAEAPQTLTQVNYFTLDKIDYTDGSTKTAADFETSLVFASNPDYPDHVMGMLGSMFPQPFVVSDENGEKNIQLGLDEAGILEGINEGEVKNIPMTMTDDSMVIDLSGENIKVKTITLKAVTQDEFYSGDVSQFYGLFDDM